MISSIALVIPSLSSGGAERVVACLALALREEFRTCVFVRRGAGRHYDLPDVPVVEVDMTAEGMLAAVAEHRIDLVLDHYHWDADHVRMMAGLADQGLKIVLTEHNAYHYPLFQASRGRLVGQNLWFHDRYEFYRKFCAVTVLNEDARQSFARHLDNVRRIGNPLPYSVATTAASQGPTVLNVSNFGKPAKRLDLLYRSFAEVQPVVPEARLVIVGDYIWLHDRYFQKASGVDPGRVHCAGRSRRVAEYYGQAAVFALTSEIEGQPMVLLEAAHHGLPQVAFDLPGLRDQVIDGETGYLVPFGDTQAFAARLCEVLQDPTRARAMGRAAREFVGKAFAVDKIVQDWRDLIHEIDRNGRIATTPKPHPNHNLKFAAETSADPATELVANPSAEAKARQDAFWENHWQDVARNAESGLDPKISFLVPVYGTEALLGRCLDSIRTQTLTTFECIVVDDGSPGDVETAFREAVGDDGRFKLLRHDRNRGLYQARSTAAQAARGLYFAHVDSDDYIHPRFAQIMFAEAMTTGAEIVECQAIEFNPEGWPVRFNRITRESPVDGIEAARAFVNNTIRNVVWNKIYARDLWRRTPGHDEIDVGLSICEDLLRNGLLFPECRRYSSVTDCLYYYCRRATSVVRGGDLRRLIQKLRDIAFTYETVKARQRGPEAAWAVRKLEERRLVDVGWYIDEFLDRTDFTQVQEEMRALAAEADADLLQIIALVEQQALLRWGKGDDTPPHEASTLSGPPDAIVSKAAAQSDCRK
ncbi:MAG: glycosyltransferase [Cypionkella sp.]